MWRACRVLRSATTPSAPQSSFLLEKYKGIAKVRDGVIQPAFPAAIVDKTTQLYGSIDVIQRKFRSRELTPSYLFDTTMEQINHVADTYRLFSVATANEVSGNLGGMDQLFNRKSAESITRAQYLIGLILNSRELKFPAAASNFSKHMERVTTTSLRTLHTLTNHGCSHYGHTHMIARISAFNPKYTGGPGTSISLGIGSILLDNDAEGHFLTPCAMYSDCIYFRTSQPHIQNSGLLMRCVSDVFYLFNIFTQDKRAGTHHDVPTAIQKVPTPPEERKPVAMPRRSAEFNRSESILRAEIREKASQLLGPKTRERALASHFTPTPEIAPPVAESRGQPTQSAEASQEPVVPQAQPLYRSNDDRMLKHELELLAEQYEASEYSPNPVVLSPPAMGSTGNLDAMDTMEEMEEMDDMDEMNEMQMDEVRMSEMNEYHELDELDELADFQADKFTALDELGELAESLDEFEKYEKRLLTKKSKLPAIDAPLEEVSPQSTQAYNLEPIDTTPAYPLFSNPTHFNTVQFTEHGDDTISKVRAYYSPYFNDQMETQLKLSSDHLKSLRVAYYDGRSHNTLPHINKLLDMVVTKIGVSGLAVDRHSGTLSTAIERAHGVWKTQPFANHDEHVTSEIQDFFQDYDIILTPACPVFPPLAGTYPKKDNLLQYNVLYYPFRLANCPQMLLPVIRSPINGMPVSLQVVGRPLSDSLVIQVAQHIETLCGPMYPSPMTLREGDVNAEE